MNIYILQDIAVFPNLPAARNGHFGVHVEQSVKAYSTLELLTSDNNLPGIEESALPCYTECGKYVFKTRLYRPSNRRPVAFQPPSAESRNA